MEYLRPPELLRDLLGKYRDDLPVEPRGQDYAKQKTGQLEALLQRDVAAAMIVTKTLESPLDALKDLIIDLLPKADRLRIVNEVAYGIAHIGDFNAFITKGGTKCFAIIFSLGFIDFLTKYLKLIKAYNHPDSVIFLEEAQLPSGRRPPHLTQEDIVYIEKKLIHSYLEDGYPLGCGIIQKSPMAEAVFDMLTMILLFVMCHELGHLLNDDLDNAKLLKPLKAAPDIQYFDPGSNHDIEFKADVKEFELLLRYAENKAYDRAYPFMAASFVFNAIRFFITEDSPTHPSPERRFSNLAESCYSQEERRKSPGVFDRF